MFESCGVSNTEADYTPEIRCLHHLCAGESGRTSIIHWTKVGELENINIVGIRDWTRVGTKVSLIIRKCITRMGRDFRAGRSLMEVGDC